MRRGEGYDATFSTISDELATLVDAPTRYSTTVRARRACSSGRDFNVMPTDLDVYKPERWRDDALFRPEVRAAYAELIDMGWTVAIRLLHPEERIYTFWKYLRNALGNPSSR